MLILLASYSFFFFNDTATTEIYTLSLHDALPISLACKGSWTADRPYRLACILEAPATRNDIRAVSRFENAGDRKSTRLNSSHQIISYAVFCLKKKKCRLSRAA